MVDHNLEMTDVSRRGGKEEVRGINQVGRCFEKMIWIGYVVYLLINVKKL